MVVKGAAKKAASAKKGVKKEIKKTNDKSRSGAVDESFEVDEGERYPGETLMYDKARGFGFIKLDQEGLVPEDKVMVHWKELQSVDRWPYLTKGTRVELSLKKVKDGKSSWAVKAKEVSAEGGEKIALQDARDEQVEFVGDKNMRFLGNVKFYDFKKGFGYVKIQEGYAIDEDVPAEFRIDRQEINSGSDAPRLAQDMEIEFGIQKSKKGTFSCYNVTLPGGEEVSRNIVEGRKDATSASFKGKIHFWSIRDGFGFIVPAKVTELPKNFQTALKADAEKRAKRAEKQGKDAPEANAIYFRRGDKADAASRLNKGDEVTFKLYEDAKGIGATEVAQV